LKLGDSRVAAVALTETLAQHLCWYVGVLNAVLQMRHQHQISSLVPAVMQRMVVDVAEDRSSPNTIRRVFGVDELAQTIHFRSRVLTVRLQCHTSK